MNTQEKVAETISEKPRFIRFGIIPFMVRPATLTQIWEVGALVQDMNYTEMHGRVNTLQVLLESHNDVRLCSQLVIILVFRSKLMRILLGWYVRHHLNVSRFKEVVNFMAVSFNATFFLTTFIFLKGTRQITTPTNTQEATARGDSSEE